MRTRKNKVECYLNDTELRHLKKQVRIVGINQSAVIRKLIMGLNVNPRPPDELHEVYCLVANIANNINQIAHVANATGYLHHEQIDTVVFLAKKCWEHIKEIR